MHQIYFCKIRIRNGLFPPPDSDSDSDADTDSCTMQDFSIGSDSDSDPMIEMYVIGTRDLCLNWVQCPFWKGIRI